MVSRPVVSRHSVGMNSSPPPIDSYKDKVTDYNFGSLIRTDARKEYAESNTIFGVVLFDFLPLPSSLTYLEQ